MLVLEVFLVATKSTRRKLAQMEREANERFIRDAQARLEFQRKISEEASAEYKLKQKAKKRKKKND